MSLRFRCFPEGNTPELQSATAGLHGESILQQALPERRIATLPSESDIRISRKTAACGMHKLRNVESSPEYSPVRDAP